jgi:hypothetical protein
VPDVLVWYRGKSIAIELKSPRGQCIRSQRLVREGLLRAGAHWWVCRSADVGAVRVGRALPHIHPWARHDRALAATRTASVGGAEARPARAAATGAGSRRSGRRRLPSWRQLKRHHASVRAAAAAHTIMAAGRALLLYAPRDLMMALRASAPRRARCRSVRSPPPIRLQSPPRAHRVLVLGTYRSLARRTHRVLDPPVRAARAARQPAPSSTTAMRLTF